MQAEQIDDARVEFAPAYMGIIQGILEDFKLPPGYATVVVVADKKSVLVKLMLPWKEPLQLRPSATGDRARVRLLKALAPAESTPRFEARWPCDGK